ncbi:hypothetical protein PMI38_05355, partial [Pseudomonas sp. GM84]|uniref:hypothetical protein n=1 Tax=Pseudomonas sp. GM84 TaxID=1144340 RepID=UPI00026FBF48
MRACQLGKGRNCREGRTHKQGDWRIFEQPETLYGCSGPIAGKPAPTGLPLALRTAGYLWEPAC